MDYRGYKFSIDSKTSMLTIIDNTGNETIGYYGDDLGVKEVAQFARSLIDGIIGNKKNLFKVIKGGLNNG